MDSNQNQKDRIYIRDLKIRCIIGTKPAERLKKQELIINIVLGADLKKACQSDNINDTVDYDNLANKIIKSVKKSSCFLIEAIAEHIANICLAQSHVRQVRVRVDKPGALKTAKSAAVEILRQRKS